MPKTYRRLVAVLLFVLLVFPQTALAAGLPQVPYVESAEYSNDSSLLIVGIPLGDLQVEYPMSINRSGSFQGKIVMVSQRPARSGNSVCPNAMVDIIGSAGYMLCVKLEKNVNGTWKQIESRNLVGYAANSISYNPYFSPESNNTYRFVIDVDTMGDKTDFYRMIGNPFSF